LLLFGIGCTSEPQYVVRTLDVQHRSWDTLTVEVEFGQRTLLGRSQSVEPEAIHLYLFNAAYDTLATGTSLVLPLDDKALGNKERLMVEVCGTFPDARLCEQAALAASPKRFRIEHDIDFPRDLAYERGSYNFRFVVERQAFADTTWERLGPRDTVDGYLLAYVGDQEGKAVKVPFSRTSGRFDMARLDHFDDFKYDLRWRLREEREAQVHFDVYAGFAGQPSVRLASIEKQVRLKTREERELDVRYFAEQAATQILDRLGLQDEDMSARAYIDDWTINELTYTYQIQLDIEWRSDGFFFGREYNVEGVLEVLEDGTDARFQINRANHRARDRWRDDIGVPNLALKSLDLYEAPEGIALTDASTTPEEADHDPE
jgi:hypothetical protein